MHQVGDLIRITDKRKVLPKGDTTVSSYDFYSITEVNDDKKPTCQVNQLPNRYREALLKKTTLTMRDNNKRLHELNITFENHRTRELYSVKLLLSISTNRC